MLVVRVLGELELELDGKLLELPARRPARLLLGYLALNRGLHARADLAGVLWPDVLDASARVSLRSALAAVRRSLGPLADRYLLAASDALGLAGEEAGVDVDAEHFDQLVSRGEILTALKLSRGPLLQGLEAEWVHQARAEWTAREADLWGQPAAEAERHDSLDTAIRYARRRVALSPLAEPPNRELIRLLTAAGDRASALAVYGELAERFRRELHAVPSAETRRVAEEARNESRRADRREPIPLPATLLGNCREPFIDRQRELSELKQMLADAGRGQRQAVLVSGEPGVGKSALVAQFASQAASEATVLLGRCQQSGASTLDPLLEAIAHYVAHSSDETLRRELPPAAGELSSLIPHLAERLIAPPLSPELLGDGDRNGRAAIEVLLSLSRGRPLLLVIEDVDQGRPGLVEVIETLLRWSEGTSLVLVLTLRSTDLGRSVQLQRLRRQVRALIGGREIALEGLDREAFAELAALLRPPRELGADEARSVYRRSRGNPFFARELLARAGDRDIVIVPASIEDLVADEIGRLDDETQRCLAAAAVLGLESDLTSVQRILGHDQARTIDALDQAVLAGAIRELPGRVGHYQFRHELLREGIYSALTETRRAYLHQQAAELLRAVDRPGDTALLGAVADHLRRAGELVPEQELVDALSAAAEEAADGGRYREAVAFYDEALDHLDEATSRAGDRAVLLLALGEARGRAGDYAGAAAALIAVGELAGDSERSDLTIRAALALCSPPFFAGDQPANPALIALLERALGLLDGTETSERAQLVARLAAERYYDESQPPPHDLAEQAVRLARSVGEPQALAGALAVSRLVLRDSPTKRKALARDLITVVERRPNEPALADRSLVPALVEETIALAEDGALHALESNGDRLARYASDLHQPAYEWWVGLWQATALIVRGQFTEGEAAYKIGRAPFGQAAALERQAQLAWLRLELGQLGELAAALPELERSFAALPVWASLRARVLADLDRNGDAVRSVSALTARGLSRLERDTNWLISAWLLAESVARVEDAATAKVLRSALEPRTADWAVSAHGTVCLGPVTGALALLAAIAGDADAAEDYRDQTRARCAVAGATAAAARVEREYRLCRG